MRAGTEGFEGAILTSKGMRRGAVTRFSVLTRMALMVEKRSEGL